MASETDKALSWLRNAGAQVNVSFKDKGGHGINQGLVQIKDSKTFRIEYPVLSHDKVANRRDDRFGTKGTLIADGKKMAYWFTGKGYVSEEPLAVSQFTSKVTPAKWISEFPKLIFSALRDGRPFGDLVAAARKPENGLTVAVEERRFDYKNSIIRQSRLTIQKKKSSGSPLFIQVVFDATQKLPVQIQTSSSATGAPAMDVFWVAQWGRPKSGSLNPSTFQIPKLAKKTAK